MKFRPEQALRFLLPILILLLASCQGNTSRPTTAVTAAPLNGSPTQAAQQTAAPVETAANPAGPTPTRSAELKIDGSALQGKTIRFWHPWQGDLAKQVAEAANEFNRDNTSGLTVQVTAWYSTGALYDGLTEALKNNRSALPQLIAAAPEQLAGWSQGSSPALVDLTPYLHDAQHGFTAAELSAYTPAFWQQDLSNGRQRGLPLLRSAQVIFYNQSWAQELGYTSAPKTPDDFRTQACAAAKKNNGSGVTDLYGTGGWLADADALTTLSWLAAFGANPIPAVDGPYTFESSNAEKALAFVRKMVDDGCAWTSRSPEPYSYFTRRMALFYVGSLEDLAVQARWQDQAKSQDQWTILPFPAQDGKTFVYSSGYSLGVLKSTLEDQLGAWVIARWLARPEVTAKLALAMPSLPVSDAVAQQLSTSAKEFPMSQVLPLAGSVRPAPGYASWRQARRAVEDAAWQLYYQPPDGLSQILPQLDTTIQGLLQP